VAINKQKLMKVWIKWVNLSSKTE